MSLGSVLRKELRRIARAEMRAATFALKKARARIAFLTRTVKKQAAAIAALQRRPGKARKVRRQVVLSPARRAALKRHGQYLGHMRMLSKKDKDRVRAVRQKSGLGAAIRLAKRIRGR